MLSTEVLTLFSEILSCSVRKLYRRSRMNAGPRSAARRGRPPSAVPPPARVPTGAPAAQLNAMARFFSVCTLPNFVSFIINNFIHVLTNLLGLLSIRISNICTTMESAVLGPHKNEQRKNVEKNKWNRFWIFQIHENCVDLVNHNASTQ